jgi:type VI secretion system protein ImpI
MSEAEPQILTLTVTGNQAAQLGARSRKMFVGKDGSIGRSEECDWVLSASGVSRVHAMIRYVNGIYFIEDRSTNGMLLNGSPLLKGDPAALKDGDRVRIDNFDISVHLAQDSETIVQVAPRGSAPAPIPEPEPAAPASFAASPPPPSAPASGNDLLDFGLGAPSAPPRHDAGSADSLIPGAPAAGGGNLDPLSFLDAPFAPASAPAASPEPAPPPASWNHSPGTSDHFRPPPTDAQRASNFLPDDWDPLAPDEPAPPPPAQPSVPPPVVEPPPVAHTPSPPAASSAPAASGNAPSPELDAILRIVVDGVMDVLRARAEIKNTFRLPVTVIQRSENNPLKFALGTNEALAKILAPPDPAFLTGTAAFDDAFDDIRCHQMAMLAGVRAGFDALLRHFDPERFEREGDGGRFGGKGRHWERYRDHYQSLVADADGCFRRLFGDEFARAYEEQLARLKSARRAQRPKSG